MLFLECNYCGKEFERALKYINLNKKRGFKNCCSKECGHKARSGENHPNWKGGNLKLNCDYCGKEFKRTIGHINCNKKLGCKNYCSMECQHKANSIKMSGKNHPMSGKKHSDKAIDKMRLARVGKYIGKDSPRWKGGVTTKNTKERRSLKTKQFTQNILKRDDFICQVCRLKSHDKYPNIKLFRKYKCVGKDVKVIVDHIMPWGFYPELRHNIENARTLCKPCHQEYGANPCCKPIRWAISPVG